MQRADKLHELTVFFQKNSGKILTGRCNLALTTHSLAHLNRHFKRSEADVFNDSSGSHDKSKDTRHAQTIVFLLSYVQKTPALKLIHPTSTLQGSVEISRFKGLTMLEIKKVPLHMLNGLGCLRHQLQVLICSRCVQSLQSLLCSCGGDMMSEGPWSALHTLNLSYNHIDALDDSLRLLPVLKMLDVSHNDLRNTRDYLECLSELAHLNLGYNRLERVPSLGLVARTNLQTLVLRNNSLDDLAGLEDYSSLLELDLGNNCVYEGAELRTLGYLHNLREVNLLGNPLAFDPNYHSIVVSKFPPEGASRKMYLDATPLTSIEYKMIPTVSLTRPLVRAPSLTSLDTVGSSLFNEISSFEESTDLDRGKRSKGKRVPKVRHVSIPDQGAHNTDSAKSRALLHDSDIQDTKREMEKMRQQHGPDWLLALQAPYGESPNTSFSDTEKIIEKHTDANAAKRNSLGPGSSGIESDIDSNVVRDDVTNQDPDVDKDVDGSVDAKMGLFAEEVIIERTVEQASETSPPEHETHDQPGRSGLMQGEVLLEKKDSKPSIFLERLGSDSDAAFDSPWTEAEPEDEEHDLCSPLLVTLQDPHQDAPVHLFLSVKETHLEERDLNGHVKERLEIKCLRSMDHTMETVWSEEMGVNLITPVVNLTFDYIRRDRKKRQYTLEDEESYQILSQTLQPFLDENRLAVTSQEAMFQCLKCSLEFALHQARRRLATGRRRGSFRGGYNSEEEGASDIESWMNEVPVCPSCSSELIVELESPVSPSNHTSTLTTPTGSLNSMEINLKPVATSSPWKLKDKDTVYMSCKSGSSTEYHSAADSLSSSPAHVRLAVNSSSSGTSTLVNSSTVLSPTATLGRQRHITEESIDDEVSETPGSSRQQPQEGKSVDSNFTLPDPTIRLSRGDETDPLQNMSTYQHEKLLELLQENMAPFSHKYSLVPPDILDGFSSKEASGATTPRSGEPSADTGKSSPSRTSDANSRFEDGVQRTTKSQSSVSGTRGRNDSQESCHRMQNGTSRPCSEDDIVVLPLENPSNEGLNTSLKGLNDATHDTASDETAPIQVGRAGSTDSEIAVLRNNSVDAISITSDSVFDSSLNAAQTNLANALSDAASKLEIINSGKTSTTNESPSELENSGAYSRSINDHRIDENPDRDARGRTRPASRQSQSSSSKESSMTVSLEASGSIPRKSSMMDTRDGDFSNVDHRLKLYFSMSLFGNKEELACMTKCRIYQFSKSVNFLGLLVISSQNIYIMKINKEESEKPSDFLAKRCQHALHDLHYIHVGPGSQGFQLDFANEGILYTVVMRDSEVCEAFVARFQKAAQQAPAGKKCRFKGVVRDHPNTTMNLMGQVFGESLGAASGERETELSLYLLAYRMTTKKVKRAVALDLLPVSVLVTPGDLYLAEENHFWPLRQTKVKGQTKMAQFSLVDHYKITDVSEVELYEDAEFDLSILFFSEDTEEQSCWSIQTENASSLAHLLEAVKRPWKEMFGVDLKLSIKPSVSIEMVDSED